jgi:hypothetical protein
VEGRGWDSNDMSMLAGLFKMGPLPLCLGPASFNHLYLSLQTHRGPSEPLLFTGRLQRCSEMEGLVVLDE